MLTQQPEQRRAVLVVDDDPAVRDSLQRWLALDGHDVRVAADAETAMKLLQEQAFHLVLADIKMPGMSGVELQHRLHDVAPHLPVVMITAYASVESAVDVIKHGAVDYLTKPVDPDALSRIVHQALNVHAPEIADETEARDATIQIADALIGQTPAMQRVREQVVRAARCDIPVLVSGEPGTGHYAVAAAIHENGQRRYFALVPMDCAGFEDETFVRELDGETTSAPLPIGAQPAPPRRKRTLQLAEGGTLLVQHVEALSMSAQDHLARRFQHEQAMALRGGPAGDRAVRFVCTTTDNPEQLVRDGVLSSALYLCLSVIHIELPPLRERRDDIPLLATHLLRLAARCEPLAARCNGVTDVALAKLMAYPWPGNVRELASVVQRAAIGAEERMIDTADLDLAVGREVAYRPRTEG